MSGFSLTSYGTPNAGALQRTAQNRSACPRVLRNEPFSSKAQWPKKTPYLPPMTPTNNLQIKLAGPDSDCFILCVCFLKRDKPWH